MTEMNVPIGKLSPLRSEKRTSIEINGELWPSVQMYVLSRLLCPVYRKMLRGHLSGFRLFEAQKKRQGMTSASLKKEERIRAFEVKRDLISRKKTMMMGLVEAKKKLERERDELIAFSNLLKFIVWIEKRSGCTDELVENFLNLDGEEPYSGYVTVSIPVVEVLVEDGLFFLEKEAVLDNYVRVKLPRLPSEFEVKNLDGCDRLVASKASIIAYIVNGYFLAKLNRELYKFKTRLRKAEKSSKANPEEQTLLSEIKDLKGEILRKTNEIRGNKAMSLEDLSEKIGKIGEATGRIGVITRELNGTVPDESGNEEKGLYTEMESLQQEIDRIEAVEDDDLKDISIWNEWDKLTRNETKAYRKTVFQTFEELRHWCDIKKTNEILYEIYGSVFNNGELSELLLKTGHSALRYRNPWGLEIGTPWDQHASLGYFLGRKAIKGKDLGENLVGRVLMGIRRDIGFAENKRRKEREDIDRKLRLLQIYRAAHILENLIKTRDIEEYVGLTASQILERNRDNLTVYTSDGSVFSVPASEILSKKEMDLPEAERFKLITTKSRDFEEGLLRKLYEYVIKEGGLYRVPEIVSDENPAKKNDALYKKYISKVSHEKDSDAKLDLDFISNLYHQDMTFRDYVILENEYPGQLASSIRKKELRNLYDRRIREEDTYIVMRFFEFTVNANEDLDSGLARDMAALYVRSLTFEGIHNLADKLQRLGDDEEEEEEEEEDDEDDEENCLARMGIQRENWKTLREQIEDTIKAFDEVYYENDTTRVRPRKATVEAVEAWKPENERKKVESVQEEYYLSDSSDSDFEEDLGGLDAIDVDIMEELKEDLKVSPAVLAEQEEMPEPDWGRAGIIKVPKRLLPEFNKKINVRNLPFPTRLHAFLYTWMAKTYKGGANSLLRHYTSLMTEKCRTKYEKLSDIETLSEEDIKEILGLSESLTDVLQFRENSQKITQLLNLAYDDNCFLPVADLEKKVWVELFSIFDKEVADEALENAYLSYFGIETRIGEFDVIESPYLKRDLVNILLNTETSEIMFVDKRDKILGTGKENTGTNLAGKKLMLIRAMFASQIKEDEPRVKKWLIDQVDSFDMLFSVPIQEDSEAIRDKLAYAFVQVFYLLGDSETVKPVAVGQNTLIAIKKALAATKRIRELSIPESTIWAFVKILKGYLEDPQRGDEVRNLIETDSKENSGSRSAFTYFITCMMDEILRKTGLKISWDKWLPKMYEAFDTNPFFQWAFAQVNE
jgi:predicted NAD-dependent protein-ADP-ribosyltransferase YbiA (DUF1768 family)